MLFSTNENGPVPITAIEDPMVQVPLSVYEEGVKAISDLMHITALLSKADRMPESLLTELINATLGLTEA